MYVSFCCSASLFCFHTKQRGYRLIPFLGNAIRKAKITVQVIGKRDEMSNFRNVSASEPCPICGKPDWCSIQYVEGGEKLYYCRRVLCGDNVVSNTNGNTYIFIKQAKDGSCLYKDEQAYLASREQWLQDNRGTKHPRNIKKNTVVNTSEPIKQEENIIPLENELLDKIYRSFLKKLYLRKEHVRYFTHQGWNKTLILRSMVRTMPPPMEISYTDISREKVTSELLKEFGSLKGVPGFYEKGNGVWTFAGAQGILLPLFDHQNNLYRLRIRLDHPEIDENGKKKNKYNNFSSFREIITSGQIVKNAYHNGCRAGSHIGLYETPDKDDYTVCYITEGEKKAIFANYVLRHPIISIPGVNSFNKVLETFGTNYNVLDYLSAKGCRIFVIAYDSDKYVNEAVLLYEKKLAELLISGGFQIALAYWNPGFGKGLDDILTMNVRPNYEMVKVY